MYKIEIGVVKDKSFIPIISEVVSDSEAARKVRILLIGDLGKWDDDKLFSVFQHKEDRPQTILMDDNYGFRLTKEETMSFSSSR